MVVLTQVLLVPEESPSRYWCTSKTMFLPGSTMPFITLALAVPYQVCCQLWAPVQALPGTVTALLAPAARIAASAALAAASHCSVGMSCGSFIRPNTTLSLPLNCVARRDQKSAKAAFGTALEPIRLPP